MSDHSHGSEAAFRRWGYAAEREQQRANRAVADLFPEVRPPAELEDGDQRFTTRETDEWCRRVAGVEAWDLDVAACDEAHLAERHFTKADDGLMQPWAGRVWCNPPFSDIEPWLEKAWAEWARVDGAGLHVPTNVHHRCLERPWRRHACCPPPQVIAMLLPASRTEQTWWQNYVEPFRDRAGQPLTTHFLKSRTRFGHPGNREGVGVGSPPFGCVLLVWRRP